MRLDRYLVESEFFESRNRAQEAIKEGFILVNEKEVKKSSFKVQDGDRVEVKKSKFYISRAAKKLEEYLKEYPLSIRDKICLDVGSSTGGFTQILLENGAKEVSCVDVGKGQLHPLIKGDKRVKIFEEQDIRGFKSEPFDIIVSDVSFISLNLIIGAIDSLAKRGTVITLLFKPQFEVGREVKRDSFGVVIDKKAIQNVQKIFLKNVKSLNWKLLDSRISKIKGKKGNEEIFYTFIKD
jgi:23S rRNA (cytidine1920-2'-O)/16S rRNA (cytidine1409-2'-O)-methyltransferase